MMSKWRQTRRNFLKAAAGVTAGTALTRRSVWAQSGRGGATAQSGTAFPKIDSRLMITPDQAWEWNAFKAQGGPTYAGSVGWKRFTDFLVSKMPEFGAVDLDSVDIPYDHYIVEDWPDRGNPRSSFRRRPRAAPYRVRGGCSLADQKCQIMSIDAIQA
jgi:TAT (twin-arginine translocation) pathway signal sequence